VPLRLVGGRLEAESEDGDQPFAFTVKGVDGFEACQRVDVVERHGEQAEQRATLGGIVAALPMQGREAAERREAIVASRGTDGTFEGGDVEGRVPAARGELEDAVSEGSIRRAEGVERAQSEGDGVRARSERVEARDGVEKRG
jgi:hypothetical protein